MMLKARKWYKAGSVTLRDLIFKAVPGAVTLWVKVRGRGKGIYSIILVGQSWGSVSKNVKNEAGVDRKKGRQVDGDIDGSEAAVVSY